MRPSLQSWQYVGALSVLLSAVLTQPSYAAHWQELGNMPDSLDKLYIDTDYAEPEDSFRIVRLMVVFPSPRPEKTGKTVDSYIQRTAIECEKKLYYGIQTTWFMNGERVVASPGDTNWKSRSMRHFDDSSLSRSLHSTACNLPISTGKIPPARRPLLHNPPHRRVQQNPYWMGRICCSRRPQISKSALT